MDWYLLHVYLIDIEDVEHVFESLFFDGVRLAVRIAEESTAQHGKVGRRHQTVPRRRINQ